MSREDLFERARRCLLLGDSDQKVSLTRQSRRDWDEGRLPPSAGAPFQELTEPGRPPRPPLVHPRELVRRSLNSERGRAALVHAVTHIEFNAINLAWDAVYRFRGLPEAYYGDWIRVADDEARHFVALRDRLRELGFDYGDFPAHDGLWDMARRTAHDPLVRMALVPRVLEARGLDVTPDMIRRFREAGDRDTARVLEMILREEVGHVAAGSRWFHHLCEQRGLEAESTFFVLLRDHLKGEIRCPLHLQARREAGFSESELLRLQAICAGR